MASAQTPPSVSELLFRNMQTPLPAGPFASWPDELREPALGGLRSRCMFLTGMALGNYRGSQGAAGQLAQAIVAACVAKAMPEDWPGRDAELQRSATAFTEAKRLAPSVPDADLLAQAIVTALNQPR